jgi:energy-converting hydrogenase Eha subunit A
MGVQRPAEISLASLPIMRLKRAPITSYHLSTIVPIPVLELGPTARPCQRALAGMGFS